MPLTAIDPTKPVLGYHLKQRIGAGGYGEVWAAEAPGGLPKAVKFIFGFHEEKRAQGELKSLNRIREVRHPFLLSLERIDIVNGQMIVITELADMCLKTRFHECVDSGLNGIPRVELLSYMRDAADALDFIASEFKLQHLDIKPENLLLVSGRIKVADFGLVKDIHDGTQSLMSGLTPAYAPPELFDGRPSKFSDQYSLAILFQEMLTGKRPFDGATAAQLASQHINERPNLRSLPREDQTTISRALSKNPELRFPSCSALIEALSTEQARQSVPSPRAKSKLRSGKRQRRNINGETSLQSEGTQPFQLSATETTKLPTLDYNHNSATCRPTLFIGVGNTGTQILNRIAKRVRERVGGADKTPAIRFLSIDADQEAEDDWGDEDCLLSRDEKLSLPLRRPEEYRGDAKMHLTWLSRRWIYNVPKSLRTEGVRPLGRLAMATHIEKLTIRLRQLLSELTQSELLSLTAETLELDPSRQPRVVLLGSISGGTCSGMGIDLAYILRSILRQLNIVDEDVVGIFTHSTNANLQRRELSIANCLAFLSELYHFSCVEEYPGDETCGIPGSTDGTTTFASTYLLQLEDDLGHDEWLEKLDSIAEYAYIGTATRCALYFDKCRQNEGDSDGLPLRTMGIARTKPGTTVDAMARTLGHAVIRRWTTDEADEEFDATEIAVDLMEQSEITIEMLANRVHKTLDLVFPAPVQQLASDFVQHYDVSNRAASCERLRQAAAATFGNDTAENQSEIIPVVDEMIRQFPDEINPKLSDAILTIVDKPGRRMAGAGMVSDEVRKLLKRQSQQVHDYIESTRTYVEEKYSFLQSPTGPTAEEGEVYSEELAKLLFQKFTLETIAKLTDALIPATTGIRKFLNVLTDDLTQASAYGDDAMDEFDNAGLLDEPGALDDSDDQETAPENANDSRRPSLRMLQCLKQRLPQLVDRVEQYLQLLSWDRQGGLTNVLADPKLRETLQEVFDEATRATIIEHLKEVSPEEMFASDEDMQDFARTIVSESMAPLTECGGAVRWMHAVPARARANARLSQKLAVEMEQRPTVIPATLGSLVTCMEVERVPLDNVVMQLLQKRPDAIELASRLHTRTDISWSHISSMR